MIYHLVTMTAIKRRKKNTQKITSADKDVEELEP